MEAEITGGQGLRWLPSPRRVRRRRRRRRARHSSPNGPFDNTRCAPRAAPRPRPRNPPPDEPDDVPRADRDPPSWKGSDMTVWAAPPRALSPTIPSESEPPFPGDERVERRIQAYVRWNAAIMVSDVVDGTTPRSPCRGGMEPVAARQAAADPLRHLTAERAGPTGGRRIGLDAGGARSDRTVRARHLMLTGRRRIRPVRHPQSAIDGTSGSTRRRSRCECRANWSIAASWTDRCCARRSGCTDSTTGNGPNENRGRRPVHNGSARDG